MKRKISLNNEYAQQSTTPKQQRIVSPIVSPDNISNDINCWKEVVRFCLENSSNAPEISRYQELPYSTNNFRGLIRDYFILGYDVNELHNGITLFHIVTIYRNMEIGVKLMREFGARHDIKAGDPTTVKNNTFPYILTESKELTVSQLIDDKNLVELLQTEIEIGQLEDRQEQAMRQGNWAEQQKIEIKLNHLRNKPVLNQEDYQYSLETPQEFDEESTEQYTLDITIGANGIRSSIQVVREDINDEIGTSDCLDQVTFKHDDISYDTYSTKGDGNCFFHAVFGDNSVNGGHEVNNATLMRQEWFKFLNQFSSLQDPNMPASLKEELKVIFGYFFSFPQELILRSKQATALHEVINKTHDAINYAKTAAETLTQKISKKFLQDTTLQNELYKIMQIARSNTNEPPPATIEELKNDPQQLLNEIRNDLENCALQCDKILTKEEYCNKYHIPTIVNGLFEDAELYKNYLAAIQNQYYYVCTEECRILASLSNTKITIFDKINGSIRSTIIEPNLELTGNYPCNNEIWGTQKEAMIYHSIDHYSHVECSLPVTPNLQDSIDTDNSFLSLKEQSNSKLLPSKISIPSNSITQSSYHEKFVGQEMLFSSTEMLTLIYSCQEQNLLSIITQNLSQGDLISENQKLEAIKCCLQEGADINTQYSSHNNNTILHLAAEQDYPKIVKLLVRNSATNKEIINSDGATPICLAAKNGHIEVVQILLDADVNTRIVTNKQSSLLHLAAYGGCANLVEHLILKKIFDPSSTNINEDTPLHSAVYKKHSTVVKKLLQYGADPNVQGSKNYTALHLAAKNKDIGIIKLLLEHTAILVDIQDIDGNTPLALAAIAGEEEITQLFVEQGANTDVTNNNNDSILDLAVEGKCNWLSNYLSTKICQDNPDINTEQMLNNLRDEHMTLAGVAHSQQVINTQTEGDTEGDTEVETLGTLLD